MTLFVMIVATLYFGREVLVPVTLALLLTFILSPLVDLLRRLHLGRVPSVLLGVVVALGIVLAIGGVSGTQIAQLSSDAPKYAEAVQTKVAAVKAYTVGRISGVAEKLGTREKAPVSPDAPAADSEVMSPTIPGNCRPAFRFDVARDSDLKPPGVPR